MPKNIRNENIDYLFKAILSLESIDECYDFFEDLCTISELQEMAKRMNAAKMLHENMIYTDIVEKTGLSTATISRVKRCLNYGNDGYASVLAKLEKKNEA